MYSTSVNRACQSCDTDMLFRLQVLSCRRRSRSLKSRSPDRALPRAPPKYILIGHCPGKCRIRSAGAVPGDRKSTRLNSSHVRISYAVFCLKKKKHPHPPTSPTKNKKNKKI